LAGEAFVLFLDKKNQKSSHLPMLLCHKAFTLQSRAAPRAVYILPLAYYPRNFFIKSKSKRPPAFTHRPTCAALLSPEAGR